MPKSKVKQKSTFTKRWNHNELCYERREKGTTGKFELVDRKDEPPPEEKEITPFKFNSVYNKLRKPNTYTRIITKAELDIEREKGTFNADLLIKKIKPSHRKKNVRLVYLREADSGGTDTKKIDGTHYKIMLRELRADKPNYLFKSYFYKELWPHTKSQVQTMLRLYRSEMEKNGLWEKHGWKDKLPERPSSKEYVPATLDDFVDWLTDLEKGKP